MVQRINRFVFCFCVFGLGVLAGGLLMRAKALEVRRSAYGVEVWASGELLAEYEPADGEVYQRFAGLAD